MGTEKENLKSPFVKFDLVVQTEQTPGVVLFENYEQVKAIVASGVEYYSSFEYDLSNYYVAIKHRKELRSVKTALEKTKRELVKSYNTPLEVVEKRLDELIDLIKGPFKKIDTFIKQNEKESKKYDIYLYAKEVSELSGLQAHVDSILSSPAFFNVKWLNSSCSISKWKGEVSSKIKQIVDDLKYILSMRNENVTSLLAHYYQTLSIESVEEFISSIKTASSVTSLQTALEENAFIVQEEKEVVVQDKKYTEDATVEVNNVADVVSDVELLNCVANSINPFTGELITGIDVKLKARLTELANSIKEKA